MLRRLVLAVLVAGSVVAAAAQTNRIDTVSPSAPELAAYGASDIGVRTIQVTDKNRPDILNIKEGGPVVRYDRTLTLEVWYPATLAAGQHPGGEYHVITREPAVMATLYGKAVRDAAVKPAPGGYPLVIISHGYPGNRFLMSHMYGVSAPCAFAMVNSTSACKTMTSKSARVTRMLRSGMLNAKPASARSGTAQPRLCSDGCSTAPLVRTITIQPQRPSAW